MSDKQFIGERMRMYYVLIIFVIITFAVLIFGKMCIISFVYGKKWKNIGLNQIHFNIEIPAIRGNIYSTQYELMATSEFKYRLFVDFFAKGIQEDTLKKYILTIGNGLSQMFPQKSAKQYIVHIMKGWKIRSKKNRRYLLLDHDVNYLQWKKISKMPYFNQGSNKSGLYYKKLLRRVKPYETLASRTIGDVYGEIKKGGKNGLEKYYNSFLSGQSGVGVRQKLGNKYINFISVKPIKGKDIITTIDIKIQDIVEKALLDKLEEYKAESGSVVLMEVATGEIKAIANIKFFEKNIWKEAQNYAVSDLGEPGSIFKVVSMMVAIEDGLVHAEDSVDTKNGQIQIAGRILKDHNAGRGGYGKITASQAIRYSSNIGVALLIEKAYGNKPAQYVNGIYKVGFNKDLKLEIPGYGIPQIRHPYNNKGAYWSQTTLPWMSFGYETQIPPIYMLAFFNAIANNGKLIKPIFVKKIKQGNKIIEKKTLIINNQICSFSTLNIIRKMLDDVVNMPDGTGNPAYSDIVRIAGKTGTVLISQGVKGYKTAKKILYQVSFCGYFPSERPKYSCIVVIWKPHKGNPSGGAMCGSLFKNIAEKVYEKNCIFNIRSFPKDTLHLSMPILKNGEKESTIYVLKQMKIPYEDRTEHGQKNFSSIEKNNKILLFSNSKKEVFMQIPDVRGMGAKDAVFALERIGLKVNVSGSGTVIAQSVLAGPSIIKGQSVTLQLK